MIVAHSSLRQSSIALQNKMRCCTRSELTRLQSEHVFLFCCITKRPIILIVLLQIDDSSRQCLVMAHIQLTPSERNINGAQVG